MSAIDDSPCNTWLRKEALIKIGRARSAESVGLRRAIMGSWPTISARSWPSIGLHRIWGSAFFAWNSLISSDFLPFKWKSWLNREEIKRFWSKILSSSWSPCILDSIPIGLRQDWLWIVTWFDWILPLNYERKSKKKSSNTLQSAWIEAKSSRQSRY